ncbi:hypothetical protein BJY01DRAFT_203439 [Aspergillus pseudoustus]|uniref:Ankyrin repeat-containing domain protein n=1 Tax=Aspergillus pseudoustus TaxID=1810923 RepID=A0ABR4KW62_9EURO
MASSEGSFARRDGGTYQDQPCLNTASIASFVLGKVRIDVRLRVSKSKWGTLGPDKKHAGILFMDICIDQPSQSNYERATVQLTLEEYTDHGEKQKRPQVSSEPQTHVPEFTDYYGPKAIAGEAIHVAVRSAGGQTRVVHSPRWMFTGRRAPGNDRNIESSPFYTTLRWENHQSSVGEPRSNTSVIHTGFALTHTGSPFILKTRITGKLWERRSTRQIRSLRKFGLQTSGEEEYNSATLIFPHRTLDMLRPLDEIARGLPSQMEFENRRSTPVDIPNGFPLSFSTPPLWSVAANGHLDLVEEVLAKKNEELEKADKDGRTALSWAAGNGHLEIAKRLLQANAKSDGGDSEDRTPLSWAAGNGHEKLVELFVQDETGLLPEDLLKLGREDKSGRTPLSYASAHGHLDVIELCLRRAPSWDTTDKKGRTPLAWAASEGREDVVLIFLEHYKGAQRPIDELIPTPLSLAARNDHLSVVRMLVESGLEATEHKEAWLAAQLYHAIRDENTNLVMVLFQYGATVNMMLGEPQRTPICAAAEYGHASIIYFLLDNGAKLEERTTEGETPLFLAAENGRQEAVKVLLDSGADIYSRDTSGRSVIDVAAHNSTVLRMISEKDKDGRLAEKDPHPDISQEFYGKVVFFTASSGGFKLTPKDVQVSAMLADPTSIQATTHDKVNFKWFHLPRNNMRWVEALMFAHYGNLSAAYDVLKPDRWVGRQRRGHASAHQARFMQPLCQGFGPVAAPIFVEDGQNPGDKDLVFFLPYLHWEEDSRLDATKSVIQGGPRQTEIQSWTKDERLLHRYLFKDDPHALHLPHLRRTLDQFGYYTLGNTEQRDKDQTVSRYQREFKVGPKVAAMVDQLWLWVLVGPSGRADTVISCFPTNDRTQVRSEADPERVTDVLQNVMLYMVDNPQAVRTAYDLAGVIASTSSRTFLGPSRALDSLQFTKIYQRAISNIVNNETDLFDTFHAMTEFRRKDPNPAKEILAMLKNLKSRKYMEQSVVQRLTREYYDDTVSPDIPDADDVAALLNRGIFDAGKASEILQKLGNFHVLDISREISLLREIKDIQDELKIMATVFEEQKSVLEEMERIVRSIEKPKHTAIARDLLPHISEMRYQNFSDEPNRYVAEGVGTGRPEENYNTSTTTPSEWPTGDPSKVENPDSPNNPSENPREDAGAVLDIPNENMQRSPGVDRNEDTEPSIQIPDYYRQYLEEGQPTSDTWGSHRDAKHSSLPLRMVQLSTDEIERMIQRAEKANQALDFLVDLKQKQSNVLDARSARIQAEEALKMTKQAEKQGKITMVFTMVTIVFLPLSFMAAFFAINITQFPRDEHGNLGLGYVLEIMIPVSALVSLGFIYIAFRADSFGGMVAGTWSLSKLLRP